MSSYPFDHDPMILALKIDLDAIKMYPYISNELIKKMISQNNDQCTQFKYALFC